VTFQEEGHQVLEDEEYDNVNELAENEVGLQSSQNEGINFSDGAYLGLNRAQSHNVGGSEVRNREFGEPEMQD